MSIKRAIKTCERKALSVLPKTLKGHLFRKKLKLNWLPDPSLTVKLADTLEELEQAFRVLHDCYVTAGFAVPHPSGLRLTTYHALPTTSVVVLKSGDQVVGTGSIIQRTALGLPLEKIFSLEKFGPNARVAEISSLAIAPHFQMRENPLFFLFNFMYNYARNCLGTDYLAIAVNPKHQPLYEDVLLMEALDQKTVASYDFANGNPAVGMFLDYSNHLDRLKSVYGENPGQGNLALYFSSSEKFSGFQFPKRRYFRNFDSVVSPQVLQHFFNEKTQLLTSMNKKDLKTLRQIYSHSPQHLEVLPSDNMENVIDLRGRRQPRYSASCPATAAIADGPKTVKVLEVGQGGFKVTGDKGLKDLGDEIISVNIQISENEFTTVQARRAWANSSDQVGFKITKPSAAWLKYVSWLSHHVLNAAQDSQVLGVAV